MDNLSVIFAKLAGLQKVVKLNLSRNNHSYEAETVTLFKQYALLVESLRNLLPILYDDLPETIIPRPLASGPNGKGVIFHSALLKLDRDIAYIFEVRSNSEIAAIVQEEKPSRIFISHGQSKEWYEVQAFVDKTLSIPTLELAQEANLGRTIMQKLDQESNNCSYAIIVMTGDDEFGDDKRARENVMHEIGFFQGKYGFSNVCLLHEEGTNLPSNIHGLVYIPFTKGNIEATFGALLRELNTAFKKK